MAGLKYDYTVSPDELARRFAKMSDALGDKVLKSALAGAAAPLKKELKTLAPKRYGDLSRSMGQRQLSSRARARIGLNKKYTRAILVGPLKKKTTKKGRKISFGRTAQMLEGGTKPHKIRPRKKKGSLRISANVFAKLIDHPGIGATRFMEKSNRNTQNKQADGFHRAMVRALTRLGG